MTGGANHSRLVTMVYPNGRELDYNYASGLDDTISRLTSLSDNSGTLESLDYLGLGTVVRRAHPEPDVDLTYIKQGMESNGDAGDQYTGLDRFYRIVDQRWIDTGTGDPTDRFQYGYDRNGNRLYEKNLVDATFSELYHADGASAGYDLLNQLTDFQRGELSDTNMDNVPDTVSTASRSQSWDFDALGNFDSQTTDGTGQTRSHNKQNQITSIQSLTTPTYDANGNMTGDENGKTLVYDGWNRLIAYKSGSTTLESYALDALNRRVTENPGSARALFYSASWQVLEEVEGSVVKVQMVWSPVYVDAMILRDRDADGNSGNGVEERLYAVHDANYSMASIVNTSGAVQERYIFDPYGTPSYRAPDWSSRSSSSFGWTILHQNLRLDSVSGGYYARNRELRPAVGVWNRLDPLGASSADANRYRAFGSSPVARTSPVSLRYVPLPPWPIINRSVVRGIVGGILCATDRCRLGQAGWLAMSCAGSCLQEPGGKRPGCPLICNGFSLQVLSAPGRASKLQSLGEKCMLESRAESWKLWDSLGLGRPPGEPSFFTPVVFLRHCLFQACFTGDKSVGCSCSLCAATAREDYLDTCLGPHPAGKSLAARLGNAAGNTCLNCKNDQPTASKAEVASCCLQAMLRTFFGFWP